MHKYLKNNEHEDNLSQKIDNMKKFYPKVEIIEDQNEIFEPDKPQKSSRPSLEFSANKHIIIETFKTNIEAFKRRHPNIDVIEVFTIDN